MARLCGTCRYFVQEKFLQSYCYIKRRNREKYDLASKSQSACCNYEQASGADTHGDPERTSDCFLTSACVEYLGKPDDCEELTSLRSFRDGYMKSIKGGEELVKEYYEVAPKIVEVIEKSEKKNEYYSYIYTVIEKCVHLIAQGDNEKTLEEYKKMVVTLQKELI